MINKIFTAVVIAGTFLMIYVMSVTGAPLKIKPTPAGILNLEFASNASSTSIVINAWEKEGLIHQAEINTRWDFLFILFYSTLLFILCSSVANKNASHTFVRKTGRFLAAAAWAAGLLDVLENGGMLFSLTGRIRENISLFTFTASVMKWSLVTACVLYIVAGFLYSLFGKQKVQN